MGARSVLVLAELTDDERSVLQRDCENCNFEVSWLTSAEMVGPKLVSGKFDTLVVHLQTPGAARACLEARTVLTRVHFPIMALAERVDDAVFNKAFRVGADDVIQLGASAQVSQRLIAIPRPSWKPAGQSRGEALIIDPDRGRADALGRLLKEAGYLIKSVREEAAGRLHLGRQSVRLVVTEGEAKTTAELIRSGNRKEWHPIWLVRARPDQLDALATELAPFTNAAVVNAYSSVSDVLYEANRLVDERENASAPVPQLLFGTTLTFSADADKWREHGFTYALGQSTLWVRTLALPPSTELKLELVPPTGATTLQLSGEVTERRVFGQPQRQSAPPGFTVRLSDAGLETWQSAMREAYKIRFGRELPASAAPEQRDASAAEATPIASVKLISAPEPHISDQPNLVTSEESERDVSREPRQVRAEPGLQAAEAGSNPPLPEHNSLTDTAISTADQKDLEQRTRSDALATRSAEPMQEQHRSTEVTGTRGENFERGHAVPPVKRPRRRNAGAMLGWLVVFAASVFGLWIASRPSPNTGKQAIVEEPHTNADAASAATRVQALTSVPRSTTQNPDGNRERAAEAQAGRATRTSVAEISSEPPTEPQLEVDPSVLPGHLGYLHVASALDTNVYVQGKLVGKTNTPVQTFCGRRFVRLGSAPGHWQSPGITFRIGCQKLNRLTLQAERTTPP